MLPFANMSGDPDQDYFADGISEDLITGLARIRWLFVIARNSTFVYKNRAVDVKEVSRALGVQYVLEGSVRRADARLRITAQLVDATTGGHHWAEKYDREIGDIFAVQDEITRSVAAAIEPHLLAAEGLRAHVALRQAIWAHGSLWRGRRPTSRACRRRITRRRSASSRAAVDTYPDYAPARSLLGFCLAFGAHMGWVDRATAVPTGREHASRAIALDDRDPWGHFALGYTAMMEHRTDESLAAFRLALTLNPNSAAAHVHLSHGLTFAGYDRETIEHAEYAMRLSPFDPMTALCVGGIAVAHYLAGRYARGDRNDRRSRAAATRLSGRSSHALRGACSGWTPRRSACDAREGQARATPSLDRLDQGECALPDT